MIFFTLFTFLDYVRLNHKIFTIDNPSCIGILLIELILDKVLELAKVRRSKTSDGVPALLGTESVGSASRVATRGDVVQASETLGVEEGVEETKRRFVLAGKVIVQVGNDTGDSRSGARSSSNRVLAAILDDGIVVSLSGDVGESTTLGVVETRVLAADAGNIGGGLVGLVGGGRVVLGETTARELGSTLGSASRSAADGGDVLASGRDCVVLVH